MRRVLRELLKLLAVIALVGVPMWFASPGPRFTIDNGDVFAHLTTDGAFLFTEPGDNHRKGFRLWNTRTGRVVFEFLPESGERWAAANDHLVVAWEGETLHGFRWREAAAPRWSRPLARSGEHTYVVCFDHPFEPDLVGVFMDDRLVFLDGDAGRVLAELPGEFDRNRIASHPTGRHLILNRKRGDDCEVIFWDWKARRVGGVWKGTVAQELSPDGQALATHNPADGTVSVWDADPDAREPRVVLPEKFDAFLTMCFSPDRTRLAVLTSSSVLWNLETGKRVVEIAAFEGCECAFADDSQAAVLASTDGRTTFVALFDRDGAERWRRSFRFDTYSTNPMFSRDGSIITAYLEGTLKCLRAADGGVHTSVPVPAVGGGTGIDGARHTPDRRHSIGFWQVQRADLEETLMERIQHWMFPPKDDVSLRWTQVDVIDSLGRPVFHTSTRREGPALGIDGNCPGAHLTDDGRTLAIDYGLGNAITCWDVPARVHFSTIAAVVLGVWLAMVVLPPAFSRGPSANPAANPPASPPVSL